ncbi:MAG: amidohydrolase family protein [Variibacter sp.]|nr:amidohydrolase family protein [Variibacter sp.]
MAAEQQRRPHLPVRPDWLALQREEALEPERPIIDPHHHFYDRPGVRYHFFDLMADIGSGHNIRATVYMEARTMYRADGPAELRCVGETEFVNGMAAMGASGLYGPCRPCAGIVGYADCRLGVDATGRVLDAQIAAGNGRFRGIRQISAWHGDPQANASMSSAPAGLISDPAFRTGFAALAPRGLSFDAWLYHTQLAELTELARAFPDTTVVLNHIGGPIGVGPYADKRDETFAEWKRLIGELARCPNVVVKVGGLGMRMFGFDVHAGARPPSSEQLAAAWRRHIETAIAAFGPRRAMFESNFPVDKGTCSYGVLWNAFKRIAKDYSEDEKHALFFGTAARVYRVEVT